MLPITQVRFKGQFLLEASLCLPGWNSPLCSSSIRVGFTEGGLHPNQR